METLDVLDAGHGRWDVLSRLSRQRLARSPIRPRAERVRLRTGVGRVLLGRSSPEYAAEAGTLVE